MLQGTGRRLQDERWDHQWQKKNTSWWYKAQRGAGSSCCWWHLQACGEAQQCPPALLASTRALPCMGTVTRGHIAHSGTRTKIGGRQAQAEPARRSSAPFGHLQCPQQPSSPATPHAAQMEEVQGAHPTSLVLFDLAFHCKVKESLPGTRWL